MVLKPEKAIAIAKQYHKKNNLDGMANEDTHQLFFDEAYTFKIDKENRNNDDVRPAWRVLVDLSENPFLMENYTLIVSDKDKKVMGMLDPNGHPVFEGNEFTDEDLVKIEEKLNIKLPEDFCEIATFFSGGYLGGISNYSFSNQNLRVYFNYRTAHDKIIESGRPWNWAENYGE